MPKTNVTHDEHRRERSCVTRWNVCQWATSQRLLNGLLKRMNVNVERTTTNKSKNHAKQKCSLLTSVFPQSIYKLYMLYAPYHVPKWRGINDQKGKIQFYLENKTFQIVWQITVVNT